MKKSRIIIPALAMIAFSVAASITGTVAWFTANRTASIDAGSYAVVKTTANLDCKVIADIGTSVTDNAAGVADVITVNGKLSDGSFDHVGTNNYIYAPDVTGTKVGKETALASATAADLTRGTTSDSKTIYTAVTWKIEFSLTFGQAGGDIGLYLDLANSVFTPSAGDTGAHDTSKGFRMAFVATNGGNTRVFADLETAAKCTYIGTEPAVGTAFAGKETAYVDPALIDSAATGAIDQTGYTEAASANMANYFGKFTFSAGATVKLNYTVVCWFEGTDENIVNGSASDVTVFKDVTASLAFSALNFKAASGS